MTDYADLDRTLIVQRSTPVVNDFNEAEPEWADLFTFSAKREDVSDGENNASQQVGSFLRARFVIRYSAASITVTPVDRLVHEAAVWRIEGIKQTSKDGRRRFLEITAVRDTDYLVEPVS